MSNFPDTPDEFVSGGCVASPLIVIPPAPALLWSEEQAENIARQRAEELVDKLREELTKDGTIVAKENNDRYDWALDRWQYSLELAGGIKVFRKDRELRLARYLMRSEEIREESIGKQLGNPDHIRYLMATFSDDLPQALEESLRGEIVDVIFPKNTYDGYWVVEKDGKIDIFRGKPELRPVVLKI